MKKLFRPRPTSLGGNISNGLAPGQKVTPEDIRDLADLIRKRYELDVWIWAKRSVGSWNRSVVKEKMRKSDATLQKIRDTISSWDRPDAFELKEDRDKFKVIKRQIEASGKRSWEHNPPWG